MDKLLLICSFVFMSQVIGGSPGEFSYGYYLANILIFVVIQPALTIFFNLMVAESSSYAFG